MFYRELILENCYLVSHTFALHGGIVEKRYRYPSFQSPLNYPTDHFSSKPLSHLSSTALPANDEHLIPVHAPAWRRQLDDHSAGAHSEPCRGPP